MILNWRIRSLTGIYDAGVAILSYNFSLIKLIFAPQKIQIRFSL